MTTAYPGAIDTFVNPTATDPMDSGTVPHATQHANVNDAVAAMQAVLMTRQAAPTVASAATIAPTAYVSFVSGVTTIQTLTPPTGIATTGGWLVLIPTGLWSTNTLGNVALASTAVVDKALILFYDPTTTKWYPSY